jgi:multiple sugar transport system substrate-binding protein
MTKNQFRRFSLILTVLLLAAALTGVQAQAPVTITWFVGLGTGTNPEQIDAQNQVVADFNALHDDIELVINVAATNQAAYDALATLIASGNGPDIVGPVGFSGANAFAGSWLDLTPLIESSGYDMSAFPDSLIDLYRSPEGLLGIPFAVFPSMIYYNVDLFDEAGLNYPPQEFGAPYVMPDGTEVEWNFDTLAEIAKFLTVDVNGVDATDPAFDATQIVQFGLNFDGKQMRNIFSSFGGADFWDPETKTVSIPENWNAMAHWYQNAIWGDHFIPGTTYQNSEVLGSGAGFGSGAIAMGLTHLWFTCCLDDTVGRFTWDFAVVPSYNGEYYSPVDADTFRILKTTEHPEEAFTVLSYLLDEAVPILTSTYGAYPARPVYQQPYIDTNDVRYPMGINWDVAVESLNYAAAPNHEDYFPNFQKGFDRLQAFQTLVEGDTGADIDVDAELETMRAELETILNEVE